MQITIIGAGKMGEALARGLLAADKVLPADLMLADVASERVQALAAEFGARAETRNTAAVRTADIVVLAVKPKQVGEVCREIATTLPKDACVLSIAAGVPLHVISNALGRGDVPVARAMPNTPCLVGAGAFGISFGLAVSAEVRAAICDMLSPLGIVEEVPEALLDAVTGLSGSGPAYIALLIEALADGGVLMGLPRPQAQRLAAQTVFGTAKLILETGQHPAQVKDAVASPGGTTIAGLEALEAHGFRAAAIAAVRAAAERSHAISGE